MSILAPYFQTPKNVKRKAHSLSLDLVYMNSTLETDSVIGEHVDADGRTKHRAKRVRSEPPQYKGRIRYRLLKRRDIPHVFLDDELYQYPLYGFSFRFTSLSNPNLPVVERTDGSSAPTILPATASNVNMREIDSGEPASFLSKSQRPPLPKLRGCGTVRLLIIKPVQLLWSTLFACFSLLTIILGLVLVKLGSWLATFV